MASSTSHSILSVEPVKASEPGALDGFEGRCACGGRFTTSLGAREARNMVLDHIAWAKRNGR